MDVERDAHNLLVEMVGVQRVRIALMGDITGSIFQMNSSHS